MSFNQKKTQLLSELSAIKNSQERFAFVIARGRKHSLDASLKVDANRVEGCLAKLWLVMGFRDGKCFFDSDSDSAIVKGIAGILCDLYSDCTAEEILSSDPSFLESAGISQHLTPNRRNSLSRVWEMIRQFASAQVGS